MKKHVGFETVGVFYSVSGKQINVCNPDLDNIDIEDIANALSKICRFGGHINEFYSVAQHSVMVQKMLRKCPLDIQRHGLLHDAEEAYLCDLPSPIKYLDDMLPYRRIARNFSVNGIYKKFQIFSPDEYIPEVKIADTGALCFEAKTFLTGPTKSWVKDTIKDLPEGILDLADEIWEDMGKKAWGPNQAKAEFLDIYYRIQG